MGKNKDNKETVEIAADELAALKSSVDALTRERDALRDQLSQARHTLNPLPAGEIQRPADLDEYKGEYRNLRDGEVYGLKVLPEDQVRGNKTHVAKCHKFTWDGTPEEFRLLFEKV